MGIKIAMFSYYFPPQYSGAALQGINLAKKLRDRGLEVIFLTVNHDGLSVTDSFEGFKVYRLFEGKGKFGEVMLWKNMWKLLGRQKPDIVHSHGAYLRNSFIGPFSKLFKKKSLAKVSLARNDLHGLGRGGSGWLHKQFISMIDKYISISSEITNELRSYGLPDEKIREIPNGVDIKKFAPISPAEKTILRKKFGFPENSLMLLYVGVIDERKNVKWLIEMWNDFSQRYPGFLVVVGPISRDDREMKLYSSLRAYQKKSENKLFFIQYTEKITDFYKMADIFILPSMNEGMPNVVLEAMSFGLPCLVNRVSGAADVINEKNGVSFNFREPETFLNGLLALEKQSVRVEMGEKARELIVRNFSLDGVAEKYIDLYKDMLK